MRTLLIIATFMFPLICLSQENDRKKNGNKKSELSENQIRVKKTTKWAAIIPGSGQIINKKYWKAPIVHVALGSSLYMIKFNTDLMNEFKTNLEKELDEDPNTSSDMTDPNGNLYSPTDLENGTYLFRRNRDLSYLYFVGIYILQIIDANVDAHMRFFDSSEDLSLNLIPPYFDKNSWQAWQIGIKLNL
tara:strand:- start:287 stop:853 length:567 start_codon:yes stop_codon:yes gene_type:complete